MLGIEDERRGKVAFHILHLIQQMGSRPRLVLLENVYGLFSQHKSLLVELMAMLRNLGYSVKVWLMNSLDSGVPQSRARVWVVAMLTDAIVNEPVMPKPIKGLPCLQQGFLNMDEKVELKHPLTKRAQDIVEIAKGKLIGQDGFEWAQHPVMIDVDASINFSIPAGECDGKCPLVAALCPFRITESDGGDPFF